jgi:hypothetical protein
MRLKRKNPKNREAILWRHRCLELVRARRAELEAAQPESGISDEKRIWAIMSISAKAAEGDPDARARLRAIQELFARSNRPQKP